MHACRRSTGVHVRTSLRAHAVHYALSVHVRTTLYAPSRGCGRRESDQSIQQDLGRGSENNPGRTGKRPRFGHVLYVGHHTSVQYVRQAVSATSARRWGPWRPSLPPWTGVLGRALLPAAVGNGRGDPRRCSTTNRSGFRPLLPRVPFFLLARELMDTSQILDLPLKQVPLNKHLRNLSNFFS